MTDKVIKLALASRVIVLLLQLLSNNLLPDYDPDVFRAPKKSLTLSAVNLPIGVSGNVAPFILTNKNTNATTYGESFLDKTINYYLRGLRHWDGEYFLHIAEHSYSYENTLAFYPLYPMVVGMCAKLLNAFTLLIGLSVSLRSWTLVVAVALNVYCFCRAASCLYELTQRLFGNANKSWNAALLFCFNPASIFFSAAYSEALFCWLSLRLMLECVVTEMNALRIISTLAFTIVARSNGLVNAGFPIYFYLRKAILYFYSGKELRSVYDNFRLVLKFLFGLLFALLPLTMFNSYAFQQFCLSDHSVLHAPEVVAYGRSRNYVLAGNRESQNSPWCEQTFPFAYSYVQSYYWEVGFLRYYKFKQLPNFMLAFPVLTFIFYNCYKYFRRVLSSSLPLYPFRFIVEALKNFPFIVHALLLSLICTFFVHIQISTRLLCSSTPCLYWFAADYMPKSFVQVRLYSKAGAILLWFGLYFVMGTIMFSNNLPWT